MKNLLTLLFLSVFAFSIQAQQVQQVEETIIEETGVEHLDPNAPVFKFVTETIDYGTIQKGANGERVFKFTNVGKSPLIIDSVKGSCGCTVPTKPEEAILPGETGEIKVKYDTSRVGGFTKTVTIASNASETVKRVKIKGIVLKPEGQE